MSRGPQHRAWSQHSESKKLMASVAQASFHHYMNGVDYGLTYQSCRFCQTACFRNEDNGHGEDCPISQGPSGPCRGLWKYGVRHYVCSTCRHDIGLGLKPKARRSAEAK